MRGRTYSGLSVTCISLRTAVAISASCGRETVSASTQRLVAPFSFSPGHSYPCKLRKGVCQTKIRRVWEFPFADRLLGEAMTGPIDQPSQGRSAVGHFAASLGIIRPDMATATAIVYLWTSRPAYATYLTCIVLHFRPEQE